MHKLYKQQKDHRYFCGNRYEKYSIKKLKLGAASVLIGAGFLFGYNVDRVEADSVTEPTEAVVTKNSDTGLKLPQGNTQAKAVSESKVDNVGEAELAEKPNLPEEPEKSIEQVKPVKENEKDTEHASTGSENANTAEGTETKPSVDLSLLQAKLADLEAQIERIRGNKKQASQIQNAEKLVAEARQYLSTLDATQSGADKKANEVSSLTSILKSIKAEEISKVNKNQNSRNGKKMQEGTGFRTGVTEQALIGSIHFDNSNGPIEKQIPVANNGDGERVINMSITYSASSSETVTDGKVRVTIPKAFLHSYKKPEFKNSSLVKSTDDRSTATEYIYDLNLNPISGGTVAESLLKLYVGTSIKTSPSKGDILSVSADFILGGEILSTKSARASFDYLSEILYKEWDQKDKILKNYIGISGVPLEFKMGSVVDGQFRPIEGGTMRLPLIFSDELFFKNGETIGNGNGRLTSYDYTISGIPDFLELDPVNTKNNKLWTLENGILTLHPDKNLGMDNSVIFGGPVLRLKEGAFNNSQSVAEVIESNSTKGFIANIEYKAVGHRPDGSTFTQIITNPDGYRLYVGERVPTIGEITNYVRTDSFQRLFSYAPNEDVFEANFSIPSSKLKGDGAYYPSEYINYFIPKDQKGNYFTKFRIDKVHRNEIQSNGVKKVVGEFFQENIQGNFKENFKLYGIGKNNQAELIKEYTSVDDIYNLVEINPEKKYEHLVLKHPGIVDEFKKFDSTSKTITGLKTILGVTVGTWKEKALNNAIQRYENKIVQTSSPENTLDSAITMEQPETGTSNPAVHTKELTKLSLIMEQVGEQTLTKDNLSRGQSIPISVGYTARDYFILAETVNNKIKNYDFEKFDSNINKTTMMVLADSNLPLKDFRLTIDNRLLTKNTMFLTKDNNGSYGKSSYNKIKDDYETVNPTKIVENYKGTGKRAYIFDSKDLGISNYNLDKENGLSDIVYKPVALTFEVENTGQIKAGTYGIDSYLVWNSESETLVGNDSSINADFLENHPSGRSIAKASIDVTILNPAEYSTSLTIAKPGTTGVRGINDVKNGQEVILSPQIENLTDIPQKVKEAVVLIPKNEAVTYLEGPIADNSDEYDIVYTTSTTTDKTTGTYVTADQITNWKDVTAVKYVFKNNYTITREHAFKHNFNLRVDQNNPNYVESTSQIFLKNAQDAWLKSNIVGLRTEDVRGKLEVYYKTVDGELLKEFPKTSDFEGTSYAVSREPILRQFKNKSYITNDYLLVGVQQDSAPEMSTYERKVTKRITYLYEKANVKVETKELIRTINYIEKNNEGNVITTPVKQTVILSKKTYTGEKTGSVVEDGWEIPENAKWTSVTSPTPSEWEKPEVKVNDQYIAKEVIDEVVITPEVLNNGNVDVNVYYPRLVPVGGDVVAKYIVEGTTNELKPATDVAKGLKVGKSYTSTAPVAGEELTATDGKVYIYKGHKATSAPETGKVKSDNQEIIYEYVPKQGGTIVAKYVIKGETTELKASTPVSTGAQVGSDYTATAPQAGEVLKQGELEYVLEGRKADSAPEEGKVKSDNQEIIYEYVPKQGGKVEVKYVIAGTETNLKDPVTLVTNGQVGSDYTATKENTLTKDGLVYELVKINNGLKAGSATETGKVTEAKQEVVYEYELQRGDVVVNYVDTEGNPIVGKASVKAQNQSPTGTNYNTNTPELKPTTITTDNGDVYEFVKKSETSAPETGTLSKGVTTVEYVYRKVVTTYVDETGKEINPSDKGTKDKKEISGYTFKQTKKDKDGNTTHVYTKKSSSTPDSPKPSIPSNEESKSTIWKDTEGNVLKPQEDGTKDKGTFTGYEYVKTILVGNVTTHIFKKVITPSHDGTPSHSDVTVTSDKSTQIANSNESTFVDGKRELPNTGTQSSTSSLLLGALAAMTGLGLVSRRRKDDKE